MCAGRPVLQFVKEKNGSRRRMVRLRLSKCVGSRAGLSRCAALCRASTPCRNTAFSLLRRGGGADGLQVCRVVDHVFRLSARALYPRPWTLRPVLNSDALASVAIFGASRPRNRTRAFPLSSSWPDPVIALTKSISFAV